MSVGEIYWQITEKNGFQVVKITDIKDDTAIVEAYGSTFPPNVYQKII